MESIKFDVLHRKEKAYLLGGYTIEFKVHS